ncbi:MAG: GAF domain-containing protein, partial [Pseudolabrys sp.]
MRRRNKTGGKKGKTQRPKTLKRHNAPKTARRRNFSAAGPQEQISALTRELKEALEQQTATSEVLKVISSSAGELRRVFETMLENAVRICGAKFGNLWLREGDVFRIGATHGAPQAYVDYLRREQAFRPDPRLGLGQVLRTKEALQAADIAAVPTHGDKTRQALINLAGARTLINVPMLKDNEVIGVIGVYRQEVRPFTDKQIGLVKSFAAQAVIAIENARLLNELRQSLEQQTATSEVLRVISRSATDLRPVFETIAHNSVHLCGATYGAVFRFDGEMISFAAHHNLEQTAIDAVHQMFPMRPNTSSLVGRTILERDVLHVADVAAEPDDTHAATQQALGIRT